VDASLVRCHPCGQLLLKHDLLRRLRRRLRRLRLRLLLLLLP
jgi:hypothetical protein